MSATISQIQENLDLIENTTKALEFYISNLDWLSNSHDAAELYEDVSRKRQIESVLDAIRRNIEINREAQQKVKSLISTQP